MIKEFSDKDLIERALRGEKSGYAGLVNRYKSFAFSIAIKIVKNREDAEEVIQDSFIKAFKSLLNFRNEAKFSTWFYRIVYTSALNYIRKGAINTVDIDDSHANQIAVNELDGASILDRKIKQVFIAKAFSLLKPEDAVLLQLFYLNEMSLEEIAEIMGIEASTVKIRLHRARPRFRIFLESFLNHNEI